MQWRETEKKINLQGRLPFVVYIPEQLSNKAKFDYLTYTVDNH